MAKALLSVLVILAALLGGLYQVRLKKVFSDHGIIGRVIEPLNNERCLGIPELAGCEKIVLHHLSGIVYLAGSTLLSRKHWTPAMGLLNATMLPDQPPDYFATYDPSTFTVTHLQMSGFEDPRGISVHGFDVVASPTNPAELFVYAINHRRPLSGKAEQVGADSVIEIFETTLGGTVLKHVATVESPALITPNDIAGLPDGKSFYFTNDHGSKTGFDRKLEAYGFSSSSVGYCHLNEGCKLSISKLPGSNGIARSQNGTIYVASSTVAELRVLESQADHSLVVTDVLTTDRIMDNVAIDENGALWVAGFPSTLAYVEHVQSCGSNPAPSTAFRMTLNTGRSAFFGEKFKIDKIFEDNGTIAAGSTSAVYDAKRKLLYMTGLSSPQLAVCEL